MNGGIIFNKIELMKNKINRNVRVKICGNKRVEDALQAISLGADAIGLLVGREHASHDFISTLAAQSIARKLPPFCNIVLATSITDVEEVKGMVNFIGVDTLQLHGDSTPADIIQIKKSLPFLKVIKSLHIIDDTCIETGKKFVSVADAIVLDSFDKATNKIGGTGKIHNWDISRRIVDEYKVPIILAGGLTPENVKGAVRVVRPEGVDVKSGTKGKDGYKDASRIELFIKRAKGENL